MTPYDDDGSPDTDVGRERAANASRGEVIEVSGGDIRLPVTCGDKNPVDREAMGNMRNHHDEVE